MKSSVLKKVAEVMETIDRALFVPDGTPAYDDSPMAIGYNATISAPHMHATCLQLLEEYLKPGMHALDVGSVDWVFDSMLCFDGWTTRSVLLVWNIFQSWLILP
ncbi:hypothetical protein OIU76_022284 [Salix suchowensis]|nr:hypothetical protein OIU76_022284 [Salix suchowensis]